MVIVSNIFLSLCIILVITTAIGLYKPSLYVKKEVTDDYTKAKFKIMIGGLAIIIVFALLFVFTSSVSNNGNAYTEETIKSKIESYDKQDKKWVKKQFDNDGSHKELVRITERNMKNADSFEHVETDFIMIESYENVASMKEDFDVDASIGDLFVAMEFRGTNSYGGVVLEETGGIVNRKTNKLTILE